MSAARAGIVQDFGLARLFVTAGVERWMAGTSPA